MTKTGETSVHGEGGNNKSAAIIPKQIYRIGGGLRIRGGERGGGALAYAAAVELDRAAGDAAVFSRRRHYRLAVRQVSEFIRHFFSRFIIGITLIVYFASFAASVLIRKVFPADWLIPMVAVSPEQDRQDPVVNKISFAALRENAGEK